MKSKIGILFVVFALVLLAGCRSSPVINIEEAPIMTSSEGYDSEQIAKAIIRAGQSLGWMMKKLKGKNEIIGILNVRKHMAKVSIKFTNEFYSIKYLDSANLKYDGTNIHSNYNGWVQNLNNAIQTQLSLL